MTANTTREAHELAISMRHSAGAWMVPGFDGNKVADIITALLADLKAKDAEIAALTKQRDDARRAKTAHFSPAYLLANARRLAAPEYAMMPNWTLATQLFAVGSTTAGAICRENGIDPDSKSVHAEALGQAIAAASGEVRG